MKKFKKLLYAYLEHEKAFEKLKEQVLKMERIAFLQGFYKHKEKPLKAQSKAKPWKEIAKHSQSNIKKKAFLAFQKLKKSFVKALRKASQSLRKI